MLRTRDDGFRVPLNPSSEQHQESTEEVMAGGANEEEEEQQKRRDNDNDKTRMGMGMRMVVGGTVVTKMCHRERLNKNLDAIYFVNMF